MSHLPGFHDFIFKVNIGSRNLKEQLSERLISHRRIRDDQISFAKKNLWNHRFELLFADLIENNNE